MKNKKFKFAMLGLAVALIIGVLTYSAIGSSGSYSLSVAELLDQKDEMLGKPVRVTGMVKKGSIQYSAAQMELKFVLEDKKKSSVAIPVVYKDVAPDTFGSGVEAVAEEQLGADGVFAAKGLLTKCASKYQAAPKDKK